MGAADFPAWYSASAYGGIGCALLSAIAIATWAVWRRRGASPQVIGALLVCAIASALDMLPLLWGEYRLAVYGPTLSVFEVGIALAVGVIVGWVAPLGAFCWYYLLVMPVALLSTPPLRESGPSGAALADLARSRTVLPDGEPWGLLTLLDADPNDSSARAIALSHALTIVGRELDNDLVLNDERVSRRHAELRWERGRVELADYGSLNGTRVNQQAARGRLPLRDGDLIEFGSHRYRLSLTATAPAEPAAPVSAPESMETRKTASVSGVFAFGAPALRLTQIQGASGADGQTSWALTAPATTIGRDASSGIALTDSSISRTHAQITRQPAGFFIADLQSSNGVLLNGTRLTGPAQIFAGDVIALGDCLFNLQEDVSVPEAPTSASQSAPEVASEASGKPTGAPTFHMRMGPSAYDRRRIRPRLAPPRLAPAPPDEERAD